MDTIIYLYQKRGLREPFVEPVGLKRYMLVRVGLDVGKERWFGEKLGMPEEDCGSTAPGNFHFTPKAQADDRDMRYVTSRTWKMRTDGQKKRDGDAERRIQDIPPDSRKSAGSWKRGIRNIWGRLWGLEHKEAESAGEMPVSGRVERKVRRIRKRGRERLEEAEAMRREALLAEREERIRRTEASIQRLALEVAELAGEENCCFLVYEDSIRKLFSGAMSGKTEEGEAACVGSRKSDSLWALWRKYFIWKEFKHYSGYFWVKLLTEEALSGCCLTHFVILGNAACIPELLQDYEDRMKSLRWILPEADYTEEVEEFVEDFYIRSGLAISLQTISGYREWGELQLECILPSIIIDFTEYTRIAVSGVPEKSLWLDIGASEEKKRYITARNPEITYISMKEKWKSAQRRCNAPGLS